MEPLPHHYNVRASASGKGAVRLSAEGLSDIESAPPPEFGGPGDLWSPETLLLGAVADCFILSFRAIARASKFEWLTLECSTRGTLERVDRMTRFTQIENSATLELAAGASESQAQKLLEKAERSCLVSNSLIADVHLETDIVIVS